MKCAVFHHKDGRHHLELSGSCTIKTVVMATKTVIAVMKTVVMPAKRQISFEIFRPAPTFVCYRRFSGSLAFSQCQDFLLSGNKKTVFFHFPPISFYRLLINREPKGRNVKHEWFGILFQIENRPNKGYCLFCQPQDHVLFL